MESNLFEFFSLLKDLFHNVSSIQWKMDAAEKGSFSSALTQNVSTYRKIIFANKISFLKHSATDNSGKLCHIFLRKIPMNKNFILLNCLTLS